MRRDKSFISGNGGGAGNVIFNIGDAFSFNTSESSFCCESPIVCRRLENVKDGAGEGHADDG